MEHMALPAKTEELDRVNDFVERQLEPFDCSMRTLFRLPFAIGEISTNIAGFAWEDGRNVLTIRKNL